MPQIILKREYQFVPLVLGGVGVFGCGEISVMSVPFLDVCLCGITAKLSGAPGTPLSSEFHYGLQETRRLARPLEFFVIDSSNPDTERICKSCYCDNSTIARLHSFWV